jgi:hypothetical protein
MQYRQVTPEQSFAGCQAYNRDRGLVRQPNGAGVALIDVRTSIT